MLKLVVHKVSLRLCKVNNTKEVCLVKLLETVVLVQYLHTIVAQMVFFWSLYHLFRCFWDHAVFIFRVKLWFREMLHSENGGGIFLRNIKVSCHTEYNNQGDYNWSLYWLLYTVHGTAVSNIPQYCHH